MHSFDLSRQQPVEDAVWRAYYEFDEPTEGEDLNPEVPAVLIRSMRSKSYHRIQNQKLLAPKYRLLRTAALRRGGERVVLLQTDLETELLVDFVLVSWRNIKNEGAPFPHSPVNAKWALNANWEFRQRVLRLAGAVDESLDIPEDEALEEEEKNFETSSAGSS